MSIRAKMFCINCIMPRRALLMESITRTGKPPVMPKRATIMDVARHAGVGTATVDRVLNGRAPVREATARRVLDAATALDYHAQGLLRHRLRELAPRRSFGFVLQKRRKWFYQELEREIRGACADARNVRAKAEFENVESLSPEDLVASMQRLSGRANALAIVAVDHPLVSAEIARLRSRGIPCVAMLSRLSAPDLGANVAIDNRKAGRTAGWAMSRLARRKGEVGILIGSHRYLGQETRTTNFLDYLLSARPDLTVRDPIVYLDDAEVARDAVFELLGSNRRIAGIYHCGGGVSGALKAVRDEDLAGEMAFICHELTPATDAALRSGAVDFVIATPARAVASRTVEVLVELTSGERTVAVDCTVPFTIHVPESL